MKRPQDRRLEPVAEVSGLSLPWRFAFGFEGVLGVARSGLIKSIALDGPVQPFARAESPR